MNTHLDPFVHECHGAVQRVAGAFDGLTANFEAMRDAAERYQHALVKLGPLFPETLQVFNGHIISTTTYWGDRYLDGIPVGGKRALRMALKRFDASRKTLP